MHMLKRIVDLFTNAFGDTHDLQVHRALAFMLGF